MKITIAGYGFVGQAYASLLGKTNNIVIVDPAFPENDIKIPNDTDAVIICVSTPQADDGSCDMSSVLDVIQQSPNVPILIKSTISLEGWKEIKQSHIAFSPEFLRAKTAWQDLINAKEILIGGGNINFWTNLFKDSSFKPINVLTMSVEELILIKYFRNSFLSTKVSFFNQIYDLCEATGIDYKNVKQGIAMDTRIGNSHTDVNTSRGYGGHCFPKDVQAILETAKANNVNLSLIKQSQQYNNTVRKEI